MPWELVGAFVLRLYLALLPHVGLFRKDYDASALPVGSLAEAQELSEIINCRTILFSWAPLALVHLFSRIDQQHLSLKPLPTLGLLCGAVILCTLSLIINPHRFRGLVPPWLVLALTSGLDVWLSVDLGSRLIDLVKA